MNKDQHNQPSVKDYESCDKYRNSREMNRMKIRNTGLLFFIALQILWFPGVFAQDFNDYEQSEIVKKVQQLIAGDFVNSLDLNDGSDPEDNRPNEAGIQAFKNVFANPYQNNVIPAFAFSPDSVVAMRKGIILSGNLSPQEYVEYFSRLYDYGFFDESAVFVTSSEIEKVETDIFISMDGLKNDRHQNFLNYQHNMDIRKSGNGYIIAVPFEISTFSGIYKKIRIFDARGNEDFITRRPFSKSRIYLIADIYFENPADTFKIATIKTAIPDLEGCFKYFTPPAKQKLNELINNKVDQLVNVLNVADERNLPSDSQAMLFKGLFSKKTINTVDGNMFFFAEHCDAIISPEKYTTLVDRLCIEFYPLKEIYSRDITCRKITDKYIYVEVKTTLERIRAKYLITEKKIRDTIINGEETRDTIQNKKKIWFKPDEISCVINIIIPLESKIDFSGFNDVEFEESFVTHIGRESAALKFILDLKPGTFSYKLNYHVGSPIFPGNDNTTYDAYSFSPKIAHGVGLSLDYFFYDTTQSVNWGLGLGLEYHYIKNTATLSRYDDTIAGYQHSVLGTIDLYKSATGLKQSFSYSSLSIPLTGHLKYKLGKQSFFDLKAGIVSTLNFSSGTTQNSGLVSYQSLAKIMEGDTVFGTYLIKDVPEYGFTTNQAVSLIETDRNTSLESLTFSGIIGITFSTKISDTHPLYLDFGPYFQYGITKTLQGSTISDMLILDDKGYAGNAFNNGLSGKVNMIGFTLGVRWHKIMPTDRNKINY